MIRHSSLQKKELMAIHSVVVDGLSFAVEVTSTVSERLVPDANILFEYFYGCHPYTVSKFWEYFYLRDVMKFRQFLCFLFYFESVVSGKVQLKAGQLERFRMCICRNAVMFRHCLKRRDSIALPANASDPSLHVMVVRRKEILFNVPIGAEGPTIDFRHTLAMECGGISLMAKLTTLSKPATDINGDTIEGMRMRSDAVYRLDGFVLLLPTISLPVASE